MATPALSDTKLIDPRRYEEVRVHTQLWREVETGKVFVGRHLSAEDAKKFGENNPKLEAVVQGFSTVSTTVNWKSYQLLKSCRGWDLYGILEIPYEAQLQQNEASKLLENAFPSPKASVGNINYHRR